MPSVILPGPVDVSPEKLTIKGDPARYLNNVLRARRGDRFFMFDSNGIHFESEVLSVSRGSVEVSVLERLGRREEPGGGVCLVMGVLKGRNMDLVVQKSVELGVARIVPVETERTVLKGTRKHERWQKVALEAARQSGRPAPPPVESVLKLDDFLEAEGHVQGIVFYEAVGIQPLGSADAGTGPANETIVVVGPEGGFTVREVDMLVSRGLRARTLGNNILRAETAAIAAVASAIAPASR